MRSCSLDSLLSSARVRLRRSESGNRKPVAATGFLFPDSDRRYLTRAELGRLPADQLRIARNEIYARKGRYFKDQQLAAYFARMPWYKPYAWDVSLSAVEQANVTLIQSLER